MPKGPDGQKRPADVVGNAVLIMRIATGEAVENTPESRGKNPHAVALGRLGGAKGGRARADSMTAQKRKSVAKKAAAARWAKKN
jgi:hypothetical protein